MVKQAGVIMASHMGVQTFATERNSQVEVLIHFILEHLFINLQRQGEIKSAEIEMQHPYVSAISSDIWDHHINVSQLNGRQLEIWCQTTSYKGNGTGTPEPNKTYEVRETLVEGITIRQKFLSDNSKDYRSIHFTVGDSAYSYKWFMDLKTAVFDLSIYIGEKDYDIFGDIDSLFSGKHTEDQKKKSFEACLISNSKLGKILRSVVDALEIWWNKGAPLTSSLADLQGNIVKGNLEKINDQWRDFTKVKGEDIKGRTNALLFSEDPKEPDPLISKTAVKLLSRKPFLSASIDIISNWESFINFLQTHSQESTSLTEYIKKLWSLPLPQRLAIRRLLLRIHTKDSVSYIQDLNIEGITEHTVYSKDQTLEQTKKIAAQIEKDLVSNGIKTVQALVDQIRANGKRLLNQARWFEAKNGTELKPSFDYVETALEANNYSLVAPAKLRLNVTGYHGEISSENVRPYTNLKVAVNNSGRPLALLKAKFFRNQEFARRCKEEAFVGLTLQNTFVSDAFHSKGELPLIMYVDMAVDAIIPVYAIKRLIAFGWHPVFSIQELLLFLKKLETKNSEK